MTEQSVPDAADLFQEILKPKPKKAEYADAPDVQEIAIKLISERNMVDAQQARVKYLFKISDKSKFAGRCSKADKKWKHLTGIDFVIEVWHDWWLGATDFTREALVYHELLHIGRQETKTGNIKWVTVEHPVEAFYEETKHYGAWSPQLQELQHILDSEKTQTDKVATEVDL